MRAMTWGLASALMVATAACGKSTPDEPPHVESTPGARQTPQDGATLTGTASTTGYVTSPRAQAIAMEYAARRWPQYHVRLATAAHMTGYWKVFVTFEEPIGAHVIIDMTGNIVDAGTSNGEH